MRLTPRSPRRGVPREIRRRLGLARGEQPLAQAQAGDGSWVVGTRLHLVILGPSSQSSTPPRQVPWEQIEDASWDQESSRLQVTEVGSYGEQRPAYALQLDDPTHLLQLVRERVTASIVLQRRVPVSGTSGLTVIGRRSPGGGPVSWMHAYDPELDPADPEVAGVAEQALAQAQLEVGEETHPM